MNGVAERELARIDWSQFRQIIGDASGIGPTLGRLLSATNTAEVKLAYWGLENYVVAQGTVYSSAEPALSVLVAAFVDPRIQQIKVASLNLMYQVLTGTADRSSLEAGNAELIDRCRKRVREGLWPVVYEAMNGLGEAALDVIELVDPTRADQVRGWFGDNPIPGAQT
jgi:hypothetical protein